MAADFADVIGPQTVVTGKIEGDAPVMVRGRVEGQVALNEHLLVAEEGLVDATVEARNVTVEGTLAGTTAASEQVVVREGSRVTATIRTPSLVIEDGAHLAGRIEMDVQLPEGVSDPGSLRKTGR